jgi:hypothetical protein
VGGWRGSVVARLEIGGSDEAAGTPRCEGAPERERGRGGAEGRGAETDGDADDGSEDGGSNDGGAEDDGSEERGAMDRGAEGRGAEGRGADARAAAGGNAAEVLAAEGAAADDTRAGIAEPFAAPFSATRSSVTPFLGAACCGLEPGSDPLRAFSGSRPKPSPGPWGER